MFRAKYSFSIKMRFSFDELKQILIEKLKEQGFGILTEINVQNTLKEKLDVDFKRYEILGACNPSLAYQALAMENEIGLLLPCNIIIYQVDKEVVGVSVIDPEKAMEFTENNNLKPIASEAKEKLITALKSLTRETITMEHPWEGE